MMKLEKNCIYVMPEDDLWRSNNLKDSSLVGRGQGDLWVKCLSGFKRLRHFCEISDS